LAAAAKVEADSTCLVEDIEVATVAVVVDTGYLVVAVVASLDSWVVVT